MQHWFYLSAIHFKLTYDKPCVNVGREQPENYVCQTLAPFDGVHAGFLSEFETKTGLIILFARHRVPHSTPASKMLPYRIPSIV